MPAWKGKLWRGVIIHFPSAIPCITIAVTELHHGVITVGLLPLPSSKVNYRFIMLYSFLYATPSLPCFFPDGVEQPSEAAFFRACGVQIEIHTNEIHSGEAAAASPRFNFGEIITTV